MTKSVVAGLALCGAALSVWASTGGPMVHAGQPPAPPTTMPVPANYREWVYLTSGLDMTYTPADPQQALPPNHDGQFDNVFVNPESYAAFKRTGTWPEQTVFVLENRIAKAVVSINKGGRTQTEVSGIELHLKRDGQWSFYALNAAHQEELIKKPASCYTCHEAHAAVDTTFVQFYPTLLPIAQNKHTLSAAFLAEQPVPTAR